MKEETFTRWEDPAIKDLQHQLEQYKNIIKEVREYTEHFSSDEICENITGIAKIVLEILDKENKWNL